MRDIKSMLLQGDTLDGVDYLIICGGSNDLKSYSDSTPEDASRHYRAVVNDLRIMLGEAAKHRIINGVIVPPPQEGVNEHDRKLLREKMKMLCGLTS